MGPWQEEDPSKSAANFYDWLVGLSDNTTLSEYPFIATEFGQYQGLGAAYGSDATDYEWYRYDGVSPVTGEPTSYNAAILDIIQDQGASVAAWGYRPATYGVYDDDDEILRTESYIQLDSEGDVVQVYLDETTLLEAAEQPDTTVLMSNLDSGGDIDYYTVELIDPDFDDDSGGGGDSWEDYKDSTSFDIELDLMFLSSSGDGAVNFTGISPFEDGGTTLGNGEIYSSASSYNFQQGDSITATFNLSEMHPLYSANFYVIAPNSLSTYADASNSVPELEFMVSNSNLAFRSGANYSKSEDEDLIGVAAYTVLASNDSNEVVAAGLVPSQDSPNTIWGSDLQVYNVTTNSSNIPVTDDTGRYWYTFDMAYLYGNYADVSLNFDPDEPFDLVVDFIEAKGGAEDHIAFEITIKQGNVNEQIYPPSELFTYNSASGQTWMAELAEDYTALDVLSSDAYDQSYPSEGLGNGWVIMASLLNPDDSGYSVPPFSYDDYNLIVDNEGLEVVYELPNGYYGSDASEVLTDVLDDSTYKTSGMNFEYLYDTYYAGADTDDLSLPVSTQLMYTYTQNAEVQSAKAFATSLLVGTLQNAGILSAVQETGDTNVQNIQGVLTRAIKIRLAIEEFRASESVALTSEEVVEILAKARAFNNENLLGAVSSFDGANLEQVQAMSIALYADEAQDVVFDASLESSELKFALEELAGTFQSLVQAAFAPRNDVLYSENIVDYIQNLQRVFEDVVLVGDVTGSIDLETLDIDKELFRNKVLDVKVLERLSHGPGPLSLFYSKFDGYIALAKFKTIDFMTDSSTIVANASFTSDEEVDNFTQAGQLLSYTSIARYTPIVNPSQSPSSLPSSSQVVQSAAIYGSGLLINEQDIKLARYSITDLEAGEGFMDKKDSTKNLPVDKSKDQESEGLGESYPYPTLGESYTTPEELDSQEPEPLEGLDSQEPLEEPTGETVE